jgi:hypothetical protein
MSQSNSIEPASLSNAAVWRFSHRSVEESNRERWIVRLRGRRRPALLPRARHHLFRLSLWLALPIAVLTSSGWLGLFVHWLALFGAASLLEKSTQDSTLNKDQRLARLEILEGEASCAAVKREAS